MKINIYYHLKINTFNSLFFVVFFVLLSIKGNGQTKTISYSSSSETFTNPERGFYKHSSTHTGTYRALIQVDINNYRLKDNVTLIYRNFNIDDFVNSPIC